MKQKANLSLGTGNLQMTKPFSFSFDHETFKQLVFMVLPSVIT